MPEEAPALIPVIDRNMLAGLQALYEVEAIDWKNPRGECSRISQQIARQFGLLYVEGRFRLDAPLKVEDMGKPGKLLEDHAWCVDGNMRVVDLTAGQFNRGLYNKVSRGVLIIGREDPMFARYRPGKVVIKV